MVEIARATSDPNMKLMILDEPTSSLPAEQTEQLQNYLIKTAKEGITYIYISHRLNEIMAIANRVFIMQNGKEKWQGTIQETNEEAMVKLMGEGISQSDEKAVISDKLPDINQNISVSCKSYTTKKLRNINFEIFGGQIVGLTGLEGNGQLDLLQDIFLKAGKKIDGLNVKGKVAYVAGDRKKEGIFPLWSIEDNQIITKTANYSLFKRLSSEWVKILSTIGMTNCMSRVMARKRLSQVCQEEISKKY